MWVKSTAFDDYGVLDDRFAHETGNVHPDLTWGDVPEGVRSFVILCLDDDVPNGWDERDAEGRLPIVQSRRRFMHWMTVDVPADKRGLAEGELGNRLAPAFGRFGINDYAAGQTDEIAPNPGLGYDGPRPPEFDRRWHAYRFVVLAMDVDKLDLPQTFTQNDLWPALKGHILAGAETVGRYTRCEANR